MRQTWPPSAARAPCLGGPTPPALAVAAAALAPAGRSAVLADLCAAAYCVLMLRVCWEYLGVLAQYTSRTPSLGIDEFYPQTILVIGYALILIRLVQVYVNWNAGGRVGIPGMRAEHDDMGEV